MNIQPTCSATRTHICDRDSAAPTSTDETPDCVQSPSPNSRLLQFIQDEMAQQIHHVNLSAVKPSDPSAAASQIKPLSPPRLAVAHRIATEVERICQKSDRIQRSQDPFAWQITLARHRIKKCLDYYQLGSQQGRVELHSYLSSIVYRYVAPTRSRLGFQGRCVLLDDFLQSFYIEALKAFRREYHLPADYTPRSRLELAEYMAFCEHYAKRKITLPGRRNQQLIILRAQNFANRQPEEASVDLELAVESPREDDAQGYGRSQVINQIREQMVSDAVDPTDQVLRDRVIQELINYLQEQDQTDCIDYFVLKLQDFAAAEIDEILGLTARERDYLQQRFKYHVEKFSRSHRWQLVHQWIGADVDQNLGLSESDWQTFTASLTPFQQQLLELKSAQSQSADRETPSDTEIAKILRCTPKQVQRRWIKLLDLAWQYRNAQP